MSDRPKAAPGVVSVALFRGINVGGRNRLPMKELVSELEALGLSDVGTYIQSGNAVVRGGTESPAGLSDRIAAAVEASHGFRPRVIVLTLEELRAAAMEVRFRRPKPPTRRCTSSSWPSNRPIPTWPRWIPQRRRTRSMSCPARSSTYIRRVGLAGPS